MFPASQLLENLHSHGELASYSLFHKLCNCCRSSDKSKTLDNGFTSFYRCSFYIGIYFYLLQRHGQGTEVLSCGTIYEGRWKENKKHGMGIKKLKSGMVEEQV